MFGYFADPDDEELYYEQYKKRVARRYGDYDIDDSMAYEESPCDIEDCRRD